MKEQMGETFFETAFVANVKRVFPNSRVEVTGEGVEIELGEDRGVLQVNQKVMSFKNEEEGEEERIVVTTSPPESWSSPEGCADCLLVQTRQGWWALKNTPEGVVVGVAPSLKQIAKMFRIGATIDWGMF